MIQKLYKRAEIEKKKMWEHDSPSPWQRCARCTLPASPSSAALSWCRRRAQCHQANTCSTSSGQTTNSSTSERFTHTRGWSISTRDNKHQRHQATSRQIEKALILLWPLQNIWTLPRLLLPHQMWDMKVLMQRLDKNFFFFFRWLEGAFPTFGNRAYCLRWCYF